VSVKHLNLMVLPLKPVEGVAVTAVQTVVDAFPGLLVFVVPGLIIVAFLPAPGLIR